MSAVTGAEIVALPGWRWRQGLTATCGRVVCSLSERGTPMMGGGRGEASAYDAEPDPDDPLLPGWLLHLLRERCGGRSHVDCPPGGWAVWVPAGVVLAGPAPFPLGATWQLAGFGPTELHALVDALRRAG